ncbi:hypothetical protein [Hydrogenophaga sp. PAMC20947]|uniref:hypothetical protein n=1 Tax=Hydrogenophaga sp. PAMC20947 TaxID=2565558 RepID=UPI00109E2260|nr:hypothetical protein [Hydrogenophaga sp. PAMC20947]QCB45133.1 hypothetical protein E5678_03260 [Hydrogenophaga sp. PAMC20947]
MQTHAIDNGRELTLTIKYLRIVPLSAETSIRNSASGPTVPCGKDPIVFVAAWFGTDPFSKMGIDSMRLLLKEYS